MIHYTLQCGHGHTFDGWFKSSEAFDSQSLSGVLECPVCGTPDVTRALMAPAVRTRARAAGEIALTHAAADDRHVDDHHADDAPLSDAPAPTHAALLEDDRQRFIDAMRTLRRAVVEHGTDVGTNFPEEARRIHYGEAEPRGIYGKAEADEARALIEEGIKILPLPALPEDRN